VFYPLHNKHSDTYYISNLNASGAWVAHVVVADENRIQAPASIFYSLTPAGG
jgi:hypothetical protein